MTQFSVLAVGAHPDDLEFLCAGTLARYAAQGAAITMGIACAGDKGHATIPPEELTQIRLREARASGAIIGARVISLGFPDMGIRPEDAATKQQFVELVRQARPNVVITHSPADYNTDHIFTGNLVLEASFYASVPGVEAESSPIDWVPPVYFMDTVVGIGFQPEEYVDISDVLETKLAMMSAHQSQLAWLGVHDQSDPLEMIRSVARFRGLQCDVPFAEGFIAYRAWRRQSTRRLLP